MERDFLGLGSKNAPIFIKDSPSDASKDSVAMRGSSGIQWSFSNKVSAVPQFLSFKAGQDDKTRKTAHDPLASSSSSTPSFMSISTPDAADSNQKSYSGVVQKNTMTLDKESGKHYSMTTYATQHYDAYPVNRPTEMRVFPGSSPQNQTVSISMTNHGLQQSPFASTGHNMVGSSMNSQPLGGVPIAGLVSVNSSPSSVVGSTDLRDGPKSSGAPAQLTIFYAGAVCVFDDVSPEKAQAIMLLAGNGSSVTPNKPPPIAQVQTQIPRPATTHTVTLCSGLPATPKPSVTHTMSLSGHPMPQLHTTITKPAATHATICSGLPTSQLQTPIPKPTTTHSVSLCSGFPTAQLQTSIHRAAGNHSASPCSGLPSPLSLACSSTKELATVKSVKSVGAFPNSAVTHTTSLCSGLSSPNSVSSGSTKELASAKPVGALPKATATHSKPPCSGIPSPIPVTSSSTKELPTLKTVAALGSSKTHKEPRKAVSSTAPASATLFPAMAVPQARKASLARFLEKRKERVISTFPYSGKKSPVLSSAQEPDCVILSINSSGSSPLPAIN